MRINRNSKVNEVIQRYVDIINDEILREIPSTKSIILSGGFGRGEGSIELKNRKPTPVNDFDMYIITEKPIDEKKLNKVANKATQKLSLGRTGVPFYIFDRKYYSNAFYIDLKAIPIDKLKNIPPMIKYYELKNASTVVYGDNYLDLIPEYATQDIPLAEGFRLLLNRMAMLATYFSMDFLNGNISKDEMHGLMYLGSKVYYDIPGALLLLSGREYKPTYSGRTKDFKKIFEKDFPRLAEKIPKLPEKVEQALRFKLKPDFSEKIDPFEFWNEAKLYIGETTKYFVSKFIDEEVNSYNKLSEVIYSKVYPRYFGPYLRFFSKKTIGVGTNSKLITNMIQRYLNVLYYIRLRKFRKINYPYVLVNSRSPDLTLFSSLPLLLYSVSSHKQIDRNMLLKSGKILKKTFPVSLNIKDSYHLWNHIAEQFSNAYVLYFFLKII